MNLEPTSASAGGGEDGPDDPLELFRRRLTRSLLPKSNRPSCIQVDLPQKAQRLLDYVHGEPGCTEGEAGLALHLHHDSVSRLRNQLIGAGLVFVGQAGKSNHLLPGEPGLHDCWRQVVALRDGPTNRIYTQLQIRDGGRMQDLAEFARVKWGADRSFVRRRVGFLVEAGLATPHQRSRKGRVTSYVARPIQAPALRVLMPVEQVSGPREEGNVPTTSE